MTRLLLYGTLPDPAPLAWIAAAATRRAWP